MGKGRLHPRLFFTPLFILLVSIGLQAQKSLKKADKLFELNAYELALENYQLAIKEDPACNYCIYQTAECYRLINKNIDAALWYRKLEDVTEVPTEYLMHYGGVMKKMGQYDKASDLYMLYKKANPVVGTKLLAGVESAKQLLSVPSEYEVSLYMASSNDSDFAPAIFNDRVIFSSFRTDLKRQLTKENESLINPRSAQLFAALLSEEGNAKNTGFLRTDLEEDNQVVSINYAQRANRCALTKSQSQHHGLAFRSNDTHLSIYTASTDENGNYYNEIPFPFNEVGCSTAFPAYNATGNIMYFCSNREGGYGGYDLYVTYYKNGAWTYPENLGPQINTEGNEITPFFDGQELFFASDLQHGLGGYDLFRSKVENGIWLTPANLGNGVNSPEDDLYCVRDINTNEIYVSSNRIGGKGNHDIYILSSTKAPIEKELAVDEVIPPAVVLMDIVTNDVPKTDNVVPVVETVKEEMNKVDVQDTAVNTEVVVNTDKVSTINIEETKEVEETFDENVVPDAVVLDDLTRGKTIEEAAKVLNPRYTTKSNSNVSLVAAKRVSAGEVIVSNTPVYFIQLAAIFNSNGNVGEFNGLSSFGSLYKIYENSATKIKLGYFYDRGQAQSILGQVKSMGYSDAFITYAPLNTSQMELMLNQGEKSYSGSSTTSTNSTTGIVYKVRLASYEDPSWFDLKSVSDLGTIEQWSKGGWTIFVLSGFSNYENAETSRIKAVNRGYADAEVVVDSNGVLQPLDRN